ncbi:MAG: hypothetical protein JSS47_18265 [Proteobacteria bacterium]|nr:hypothetical protein [Pseudomonadota bacterium]
MEQSLAPGSQTFEQDLFRLYHEKVISLEEALANADSPTNLEWLINNARFDDEGHRLDPATNSSLISFAGHDDAGPSFAELTLTLDKDAAR